MDRLCKKGTPGRVQELGRQVVPLATQLQSPASTYLTRILVFLFTFSPIQRNKLSKSSLFFPKFDLLLLQ